MKRGIAYWFFVRIPLWFVAISLIAVTLLNRVPVRHTPLMLKRAFQFRAMDDYHAEQEWAYLEEISPELIAAVIISEDSRFYQHHGFDWDEIVDVLCAYRGGDAPLRGCSTITQQTAKNLFTFGTHTWARKAAEAWWTVLMEAIWSKERILEVYMNIAEFGPGVFGAKAAAHVFFQKDPADLTRAEAVTLAACLPSPLSDQPGKLSAKATNRKKSISRRMAETKQ